MDVGQDTTLCDSDVTQQLVQLLIVSDGELQVTGDDAGLLVVASSVASQLENLSSEVLEDGSEVDRGTGTDTLGVVALAEQTVNTADGESQTGLGRSATKTGQSRGVKTVKQLGWPETRPDETRRVKAHCRLPKSHGANLRLRVLGTAGLAAGLAASSHFACCFGELEKVGNVV